MNLPGDPRSQILQVKRMMRNGELTLDASRDILLKGNSGVRDQMIICLRAPCKFGFLLLTECYDFLIDRDPDGLLVQSLGTYGPKAEGKVAQAFDRGSRDSVYYAYRVLEVIGTSRSINTIEAAAARTDNSDLKQLAANTVTAIREREQNGNSPGVYEYLVPVDC